MVNWILLSLCSFVGACGRFSLGSNQQHNASRNFVDSSGAPIAAAEVSTTHVATNQVRATTTNDQGYYVLPALEVGEYRITVQKPGFKTQVRPGVILQVNQRLTVDFSLAVGDVTERMRSRPPSRPQTHQRGVGDSCRAKENRRPAFEWS